MISEINEILSHDEKLLENEYDKKVKEFGLLEESHPNYTKLKKILCLLFYLDKKVMYSSIKKSWAQKAIDKTQYDNSAFGYGTVPLSSFDKMFNCFSEQVTEHINNKRTFYALGSSIGWVGFIAALYYGFEHVVGVEILPEAVEVANALIQKFDLQIDLSFISKDVCELQVHNAGIIWIPGLLWPANVLKTLHQNLFHQIDAQTLFFSESMLAKSLEHMYENTGSIQAKASWSSMQSFWFYKKKSSFLNS